MTAARPASPALHDARWVVVLAGGVGSRFWPLSTARRPKQLLPLVGAKPLLVETLDRLAPLVPASRTLVLTNASLVGAIADAAPAIPRDNIIAEPHPAGTAAALTWAAHVVAQRAGRDATMISVHADWSIADAAEFRTALGIAASAAAEHRSLVTVGIVPTRADPGFGYIEPGDVVSAAGGGRGVRRVALPVALPAIFTGLKMAAVLAVVGAIVGEFVGSDRGLGYVLTVANGNLDAKLVFATVLALSTFGLLFFFLVELAEWVFVPWNRNRSATARMEQL